MVLLILWIIGTSKWLDARLHRIITAAFKRWTNLEAHDFLDLLHIGEGYSVTELEVDHGDWLVGRRLDELRLSDIGINVIGVQKNGGDYIAAPTGTTYIDEGDKLLLYGSREIIVALDKERSNPEEGKKLIDFLLSKEVERMLAFSESAQIPLREDVEVPENVTPISEIKAMDVDFEKVADVMDETAEYLRELFVR